MSRSYLFKLWRTIHAWMIAVALAPLWLYRTVLSPMKRAPTCRFIPSCSEYAVDAIRQRGILIGFALTFWRVLRCQPLCDGGVDPVPVSSRTKQSCACHGERA